MTDDGSEVSSSLQPDAENTSDFEEPEEDRDEVGEVRKMASKDTFRVHMGRYVVTVVLLFTGLAVTFTTYIFLRNQEKKNFQTAFEQFSRTVGDAAVNQQKTIRDSFRGFANHMSSTAQAINATWPFFTLPQYELHAANVRLQSGMEVVGVAKFINAEDADKYLEYAGKNYEAVVKEGHETFYGNLDRLSPVGYHPYYTAVTAEGYVPDIKRPLTVSVWHYSPPLPDYGLINANAASVPDWGLVVTPIKALKNETLFTRVMPYPELVFTKKEHQAMHSQLPGETSVDFPHSFVLHPIHEIAGDPDSEIVAWIGAGFAWDYALRFLLPENVEGIFAEVHNNCNQSYSYLLKGHDAFFIGEGAKHEKKYENMEVIRDLALHTNPNFTTTPGHCQYTIHIFPSIEFAKTYDSKTPEIYAGVVALTFLLVAAVFFIYDMLVQKRNDKLIVNAARSNAIVSSMFPDAIRDRIMEQNDAKFIKGRGKGTKNHLNSFLLDSNESNEGPTASNQTTKPLADLFLETTIMFADIVGFTAWSSVREPSQVFSLLESVFSAFDTIAKRCRIFKVETVGDCYVAVAGLPEPRKDHAVAMARYTQRIMDKMKTLTKQLEVSLGPDTGELTLRIGLHSGPVTGGVLRGARSRFQLFGDTMNTAARVESTGEAGRIQVSQETANLLVKAGKQAWVQAREDSVLAKGKGTLQTYWLTFGDESSHAIKQNSVSDYSDVDDIDDLESENESHAQAGHCKRTLRLIDWNVEQLLCLLKQIVARRNAASNQASGLKLAQLDDSALPKGKSPMDEVQEIITLPDFDRSANRNRQDPDTIELPSAVTFQLKLFVTWIASMYRTNPFHNFDHASHVLMSVIKLMSRIVAPSKLGLEMDEMCTTTTQVAVSLHDHTYGITSDPLTQFACAFSALIHDIDHVGIPNAQLVAEQTEIAARYQNRSVAEQNSLDLAWNALMGNEQYADLRATIFTTQGELCRFRQLVVNSVMATDIVDKDLKALRNARWDKAFKTEDDTSKIVSASNQRDVVNRKATIVIEHLIQASDVSHTMQHWHVFRKWNQRLFEEMYRAYKAGRAEKNPAEFWYQGEIGFFDFYVIPLTKKLKDCGVFGVSSDEYLNYALKNREEWEARGQEVVADMVETVSKTWNEEQKNSTTVTADISVNLFEA